MKLMMLCVLLFFNSIALLSNEPKWGKLNSNDMNLKNVSFEKDADAVVLYESGSLNVSYGNSALRVYKRIKILTKEGLDIANQEITYYAHKGMESITNLRAQTINHENGETKTIPLRKNEFYNVDINSLYKAHKFTFPDVKVGSIIEFKYVFNTTNLFFLEGWDFQHNIPTLESNFDVKIDADLKYTVALHGEKLVDKYAKTNDKESDGKYSLKNIPSTKSIEHVYNIDDNLENISFQLKAYAKNGTYTEPYRSWEKLAKEYLQNMRGKQNKSFVKKISESIPNGKTEQETLNNILEYVRTNFSWNGFQSIYPTKTNRELEKSKQGTVADLNLLLYTILEKKNISSTLLLISTRNHGKIMTSFPKLQQFNKLINFIELKNGENYIIDASNINEHDPIFMPLQNYNHYGFLLLPNESKWIQLKTPVSVHKEVQSYDFRKPEEINLSQHYYNSGFFWFDDSNYFELEPAVDSNYETTKEKDKKEDGKFTKTLFYSAEADEEFFLIENPILPYLESLKLNEETRNRNIEYPFQSVATVKVKCKMNDDFDVQIPADFNQNLESQDLGLHFYQNATKKENHLIVDYQFFLGNQLIESKDFQQLKKYIDNIVEHSQNEILIRKKS